MEFTEIMRTANKLCGEAQMAFNGCDLQYAEDKLLELKNFLVDNCDDTPEEPEAELAADEAATEAEIGADSDAEPVQEDAAQRAAETGTSEANGPSEATS